MNHAEGMRSNQGAQDFPPRFEEARALVHEPFESYHLIRERLEKAEMLAPAVETVKKLYAQELAEATFLTPRDWEMLATLWLCDEETATHSVDTYRIARNRIQRPLHIAEFSLEIDLSEKFSEEGVSEEQFLRACLFHDIGKLAIPIEVLTNHITDEECARILYANYDSLGETVRSSLNYAPEQPLPESADALFHALRAAHRRPQVLVPVYLLLSSNDNRVAVAQELDHLGLSLNDSLLTIMRTHDRYSRTILEEEGLPHEAVLAGAHHRHQKGYSPTPHTFSVGTRKVEIDLSDIIHLADVTQAMRSARHYKKSESELTALATLVAHATYGMVDPFITYLWVSDELSRLPAPGSADDKEHYRAIKEFLDRNGETYHSRLTPA